MKNRKNNFAIILVAMYGMLAFGACKKDENSSTKMGTYEYQGKTVDITIGDYRDVGEEGPHIFFSGQKYTDGIQLRFPKVGVGVIPIGNFIYNGALYYRPGYKPATEFNGGNVTTETNILGDEINGGTIKIEKNGGGHTITFNLTTAKGSLKGSFSGTLKKI